MCRQKLLLTLPPLYVGSNFRHHRNIWVLLRFKEKKQGCQERRAPDLPGRMTMFTDGLKALGKDEAHEVKELTEVLAGRVE